MELEITYHVEILGHVCLEGETIFPCQNIDDAFKKLKNLRGNELHAHLIKTIDDKGKIEKIIID